jgi:phosphomevalonate kinase
MIVSAPGKVLLLGGYAVLEGYPALSIAVVDADGAGVKAVSAEGGGHRLISKEFGIDRAVEDPEKAVAQAAGPERFAVCAYSVASAYLREKGKMPGDLVAELDNSPIFGAKDEKSGLGSSAAATVALIGLMMESAGLPVKENREKIHRLAQLAHSMASGRVGSGFDVATSCFGTITYSRDPKKAPQAGISGTEAGFGKEIAALADKEWPGISAEPASLGGFDLMAFNIKGAKTSTVSSVKAMKRLAEYVPELYSNLVRSQAEGERMVMEGLSKGDEGMVREGMHAARAANRRMTDWVERVGMLRFDPIEPRQLGVLIDKAEEMEGVVAGRCPGAGGFDSVAFIVRKKSAGTIDKIRTLGKGFGLTLEYVDAFVTKEGVKKL